MHFQQFQEAARSLHRRAAAGEHWRGPAGTAPAAAWRDIRRNNRRCEPKVPTPPSPGTDGIWRGNFTHMSRIGFCGAKNAHVVVVGSRPPGWPVRMLPTPLARVCRFQTWGTRQGSNPGVWGDIQQASPDTPGNKIPLRRAPIRTLTVPITMSVTPVPTLAASYRTWQLRMFISRAGQTWDATAMVLVAGCWICPMAHCSR